MNMHPRKITAFDHCPVLLPWFSYTRGAGALSRLRRRIHKLDTPVPAPFVVLAALLHPFRALKECFSALHACLDSARLEGSPSWLHCLLGSFWLSQRHNLPPRDYYLLRLWLRPPGEWGAFLSHRECVRVLQHVEARPGLRPIGSKTDWDRFCEQEGLPTAPVIALLGPGRQTQDFPVSDWLGMNLFIKPDKDYSGRGASALHWDATLGGWELKGAHTGRLLPEHLSDFLASISEPYVLQECLVNHPIFHPLACKALVNVRFLTVYSGKDGICSVSATLRLPPGEQVTSDVPGRTVLIPVDLENGTLQTILGRDPNLYGKETFGPNDAQVTGLVIPFWTEAVALVQRAHQLLPDYPAIGWDLVFTPTEVRLLEGNVVWHGYLGQHYGLVPFGETKLPEAFLEALDNSGRAGAARCSGPILRSLGTC